MLWHCSSTVTKDQFLIILYGNKWPLCVDVPFNPYSFIHSDLFCSMMFALVRGLPTASRSGVLRVWLSSFSLISSYAFPMRK